MCNAPDVGWSKPCQPMYLEIFSGSGRLTAALEEMGLLAHGIDITHGEAHDVLKPDVKSNLFRLLRRGMVKFVWIGMPSTTFSLARKHDGRGAPPLRSDSQPRGVKSVSSSQQKALKRANALFDFSMSLISQCRYM